MEAASSACSLYDPLTFLVPEAVLSLSLLPVHPIVACSTLLFLVFSTRLLLACSLTSVLPFDILPVQDGGAGAELAVPCLWVSCVAGRCFVFRVSAAEADARVNGLRHVRCEPEELSGHGFSM